MGTLGKILLFVNFLAAAGVAYFAAQDWARRQEVAATALRYQLVLVGLPVEPPKDVAAGGNSVPLGIETAGQPVESVRPSLLAAHFQGAEGGQRYGGGGPVNTQVDEVRRVQTKVNAELAAASGPAAKLALLCGRFNPQGAFTPGLLTNLAESFEERDLLRNMVRPDALANPQRVEQNAAQAEEMLKRRFDAVLSAPNPAQASREAEQLREVSAALAKAGDRARQANARFWPAYRKAQEAGQEDPAFQAAAREQAAARKAFEDAREQMRLFLIKVGTGAAGDEADRRRRIAHLLAHLDRDAAWQKRVGLVVGLRTYVAAVQSQTDRLREMGTSAQQQIALDQGDFSEAYESLKSLANERALLLERQRGLTADLADQRRRDLEAVKGRSDQLARRQAEFGELQQQLAAALARQAEVEAALLADERLVGDTLRRNFDLEDKLKAAEERKTGGRAAAGTNGTAP